MVEAVRRITNVTDIPVFADADTGYGKRSTVFYTGAGLHSRRRRRTAHRRSGSSDNPARWAGRRLISVEEASVIPKPRWPRKKRGRRFRHLCALRFCRFEGGNFEEAVKRRIAYVKKPMSMRYG